MKFLLLIFLMTFSLFANVIKIQDKYYAYNENCYGNSMELSFYEIQSLANNNEEKSLHISDRYEKCYNKEKLYISDGYARNINYKIICKENEFKNGDCPITKSLNKEQIIEIIKKEIKETKDEY